VQFLESQTLHAARLTSCVCISQASGLVPIVEPEVLLDGEHDIDATLEVAEAIWAETFKYLADNKVGTRVILISFLLSICTLFCRLSFVAHFANILLGRCRQQSMCVLRMSSCGGQCEQFRQADSCQIHVDVWGLHKRRDRR